MDLSRDGYSHNEIKKVLHSSNRQVDFRYELLDEFNQKKRDLMNVTSAEISQSMLAQIKRTARFSLIEDNHPIDYLRSRIKPYMRLKMSTGWVEFPLGVFLLSTPVRKDSLQSVEREIEAYDLTLILLDDMFTDRYSIPEGTNYYDAIIQILIGAGITYYNLERTDKVLPRTIEFDPGTSKLEAVNGLLSQFNFTPIYVDEEGYFVSRLYVSPSERAIDYEYLDDNKSVIFIGSEAELDTFNIPNVFTVVRTNEEEEPLTSTFINDKLESPLSTINRGRIIVDFRTIENIADQEALDEYVKRIAVASSQVYGRLRFRTALMPFHSYANVLRYRYNSLNIDGKYLELNWSMSLKVGSEMQHELREVVSL